MLRASPRRVRELCRRECREHEQHQAHRLVGLANSERPNRRDEEVIVRERCDHRCESRWAASPTRSGEDDRQQVQQDCSGQIELPPQQRDQAKGQSNARERDRVGDRASQS